MERAHHERLIETLRGELVAPAPPARPALRIPAERYRSAAQVERERAAVFGGLHHGHWRGPPRVLAAASALAAGHCLPIDVAGVSLILTRGSDGVARGFANACRHRATRLVDAPCAAKALVCPYHGWTYDLAGQLIHAPHPEAFAPGDRRDLGALPIAERHGLIWIGADLAGYLGGLDADLAALGLDRHVVWRARRATPRCNWKLIVEAFLDGYHIRILHRDSVYRFFIDAASRGEPVGPHIRAVTARRALRDAPGALAEVAELRTLATPSYVLFPGTVVIVHPDFVSCITLHPLAADATDYEHIMLVPAARADEAAHWDKSWTLIEDTVFQREDLWVCEQVQRGLAAGATDELVFGELEEPVRWFHAELDRALAGAP
jgi:glycine betaine catabolism A